MWPIALCLITLHSPDGTDLFVSRDDIKVVRAIEGHQDHVTAGTHSVVYIGERAAGFGVRESSDQVHQMIRDCDR